MMRTKLAGVGLASLFAVALATSSHAATKDGDHYHVDYTISSGCKVGVTCTVTYTVTGKGGFHVNTEFPTTTMAYKKGDTAVSQVVGNPTATVTKEKGVVVAQVKILADTSVAATAKFAVCSDDMKQCEPNAVDLSM
jgi:hypothetical protein